MILVKRSQRKFMNLIQYIRDLVPRTDLSSTLLDKNKKAMLNRKLKFYGQYGVTMHDSQIVYTCSVPSKLSYNKENMRNDLKKKHSPYPITPFCSRC